MNAIISTLSRRRPPVAAQYGLSAAALAVVTLVRLTLPLDVAPFLFFLPLMVAIGLSFSKGSGFATAVASTVVAAWFFARDTGVLLPSQWLALVLYLLVSAALVTLCAALRQAMLDTERAMASLNLSNASLAAASEQAEAAREQAEVARGHAESANRAKSAFLANMSHELRTPLSAVIGYSEMLEEEAEESGERAMLGDLGKIKANAKHLLSLINDVLDLSKIEANKMETRLETIEVAGFARDAASTVETLMRRRANTLTVDLGPALGSMHSDAVKLRQCLFNLLSNAAKFTENGRVVLRVRRDSEGGADWLLFEVEDSGIGMSREQIDRLFQRFVQADETTTRRYGGTGLGLALTRAFARLLGGTVTVTSQEGQGTCFTLRLPAEAPSEVVVALPDSVGGPDVDQGDRTLILIVDDEAAQRDLLSRFLVRQGFAVRTAADGQAGLALARELQPRAILLDVMMPVLDGWSVLQQLKADPDVALIPVVMVSFTADRALGTSLGAADVVPKPVDWARLRTVVDQFREGGADVLVVDDDPDARARLHTTLSRHGWTVTEAGDGAEALAKVRHAPPHLIVLDLTMPVMDGFTFLRRLREMPGCADIPVVVLSARDMTGAERAQLDAEANRVFAKGETSMAAVAAELRSLERASGDPAAR